MKFIREYTRRDGSKYYSVMQPSSFRGMNGDYFYEPVYPYKEYGSPIEAVLDERRRELKEVVSWRTKL